MTTEEEKVNAQAAKVKEEAEKAEQARLADEKAKAEQAEKDNKAAEEKAEAQKKAAAEEEEKNSKKPKTKSIVWSVNVKYNGKHYSAGTTTIVDVKDLDELVAAKVIRLEE